MAIYTSISSFFLKKKKTQQNHIVTVNTLFPYARLPPSSQKQAVFTGYDTMNVFAHGFHMSMFNIVPFFEKFYISGAVLYLTCFNAVKFQRWYNLYADKYNPS